MRLKRFFVALALSLGLMCGDVVLLVLVNLLFKPGHPPHWLNGAIFYFLAWPVLITQHLFPSGRPAGGPTFPAVALGGLIDLMLFTIIFYLLLSSRAPKKGASRNAG